MKRRDYLRKRAELDAEYKQRIEALEIVWRMFNADESLPTVESARDIEDDALQWPFEISRRDVVRQAIATISGSFTAKDVRSALKSLNNDWSERLDDNQLSSLVARLADKKEIGVLKAKSGREPAVYTVTSVQGLIKEENW